MGVGWTRWTGWQSGSVDGRIALDDEGRLPELELEGRDLLLRLNSN